MKKILHKIKKISEITNKLENLLSEIKNDFENNLDEIELEEFTEWLKAAFHKSIHPDYWDINDECDITYETGTKEREAYFIGIKYGYNSALFWLADSMDLINFFEDEILPIFKFIED